MKVSPSSVSSIHHIIKSIPGNGIGMIKKFRLLQKAMSMMGIQKTSVTASSQLPERRSSDRRNDERRCDERRDILSWRSQIWKRTSLNQYCRRNTDRRDGDRRLSSDRRLAFAMLE